MNPLLIYFILFLIFEYAYSVIDKWCNKLTVGEIKLFEFYFWPGQKFGFSFKFTRLNQRKTELLIEYIFKRNRKNKMSPDDVKAAISKLAEYNKSKK